MKPLASGEVLEQTFDKADITVNFNGVEVGSARDVYMPNNAIININQDFNKHPTTGYGGLVNIDGKYHIVRFHGAGSVTPTFVLDSKYIINNDNAPIVEWEFHVKNGGSSNMTVNNPVVSVSGTSNFFNSIIALTDQMYIEPGKTNVYVFRAEMYSYVKTVTYSLAYVY